MKLILSMSWAVIERDIILAYADTLGEGDIGAVTVKIGKIKTKLRNSNIVSMRAREDPTG